MICLDILVLMDSISMIFFKNTNRLKLLKNFIPSTTKFSPRLTKNFSLHNKITTKEKLGLAWLPKIKEKISMKLNVFLLEKYL